MNNLKRNLEKMNNDLEKIRHYQGTIADFKNFFDQKASETMGKPENTNAYDTPAYQGFDNIHPTRGAKKSPHWSMNEADNKGFDIFGYKTKDFDICPGAESLYKRIVDEEELPITKGKMTDDEIEMVRQSAELQDLLFAREKRALSIGAGKSDVQAAESLAKKIMTLAKKMGLEKEHGYVQGHVDKIKSKMIKENIDREIGHTDDEPGMIASDLRIIERYARELRELVEGEGTKGETDFPHWWQSKIVKAKDYIVAAKHYLRDEVETSGSIPTFENFLNEAVTNVKVGDLVAHDKTGERYKVIAVPSKTKIIGKNRKGEEKTLSKHHITMIEAEVNEATNINDPILMAFRAAKMKREKELAKPKTKRKPLYGKQREMAEDKLWNISQDLKDLYSDRGQLLIDMEQEAEVEGGPIADRYGAELDRIESEIQKLIAQRNKLEMRLAEGEENEI